MEETLVKELERFAIALEENDIIMKELQSQASSVGLWISGEKKGNEKLFFKMQKSLLKNISWGSYLGEDVWVGRIEGEPIGMALVDGSFGVYFLKEGKAHAKLQSWIRKALKMEGGDME